MKVRKNIDDHVQQALDLDNPDVAVDRRQHHKGQYDQFWEAGEQYIQSTIVVAVSDMTAWQDFTPDSCLVC